MSEIKWIKWHGTTTDGLVHYKAEGATYEEVYDRICEKYGYGNVLHNDAYEMKLLEVNSQNVDDYMIDYDSIDYEKYEDFLSNNEYRELTDDDYRELIEDDQSQAYYQKFEIEK